MTRRRQKDEENLFATRLIALLGESWTIKESPDEREWPDLLIETATGFFGLEIRKLYADETSKGSSKRTAESSRVRQLNRVADLYYESGALPPARVQFYGTPDDPAKLANYLAATVPLMQPWEQKKLTCDNHRWMYVRRLPRECGEYRRWDVVSDSVGFVGIIDLPTVQCAIQRKSAKLAQYKKHVKDIRLLLVCDRTRNSGKKLFGSSLEIDSKGFERIYMLSYPDELMQISA